MSGIAASGEFGAFGGGIAGTLLQDSAAVRQQLDTLTTQAGSGYVADTYAGLGSNAGIALAVAPQLASVKAWQNDINAATGPMQVAQTALTQISAIASTFYADTNNLNGLNASEVDSTASAARQALSQVAGMLDSTDGGTYVFAGQDSSNAPVPNPDTITGSGFYSAIQSAVAGLATTGAPAVIASTLATAASNAPGVSPFSPGMSQPAAVLQAALPSVATGPGTSAPIGIPASANAFVASTGSSTTGSYSRDILRALATLGSLSSSQINDPGFAAVVADVRSSLGGAITALNEDAGVLGNTQASLATEQTTLGDTATALSTQLSGVQSVDMAQTLSTLMQMQTRLQASYQLINGLQTYSLAKLITPTVG